MTKNRDYFCPFKDEDTKDLDLQDVSEGTSSTKKKKHLSKKEAKALSRLEDAEIDRVEGQVISGEATNTEPKTVQVRYLVRKVQAENLQPQLKYNGYSLVPNVATSWFIWNFFTNFF